MAKPQLPEGSYSGNPDTDASKQHPVDNALALISHLIDRRGSNGGPGTGSIISNGVEINKILSAGMSELRAFKDAGQGESARAKFLDSALREFPSLLEQAVSRIGNESSDERSRSTSAANNPEGAIAVLKAYNAANKPLEDKRKEAEAEVEKRKKLDARMTLKGQSYIDANEEKAEKEKAAEALEQAALPGEALRARAKYARSLAEERKNPDLEPGQRKNVEERIKELQTSLKDDLDEQYKRNIQLQDDMKEAVSSKDLKAQRDIGDELGKNTNLIQELRNILENFSKTNANSLSNVVDNIGKFVATFAVGSLISRFAIQEPYRFTTAPALDMLGNQGEVGSVLSGALNTLEGYKVDLNQTALSVGMGAGFTGLATIGRNPLAGGLMLAGGAALGLGGATGQADNWWMDLPFTTDPDEIMGNQIASQVANPQRLLQNMGASAGGLLQLTGEGENLGYSRDGPGSVGPGSSGNSILDDMLLGNGGLRRLGYDANDAGAMLTGAAANLIGDRDTLQGAAEFSGRMGRAYNLDPNQVMDMMGTAQRYGSDDVVGSVAMTMGAVADEDGKISNFAANVLVPALMKVTETMAVQNLARSSEDIEEQVASLYNFMSNSDTNAGDLMKSNPVVFNNMISSLSEAAGLGQTDAARAAYSMYNGSTLQQIVDKDPEVALRNASSLLSRLGLSDRGPIANREEFYSDPLLVAAAQSGDTFGIGNPAMAETILTMLINSGGFESALSSEDFKKLAGTGTPGDGGAIDERLQTWLDSEFSGLLENLGEQRDALLGAAVMLTEAMKTMQSDITTIIYSPEFLTTVEKGMSTLVEEVRRALGIKSPEEIASETARREEAVAAGDVGNVGIFDDPLGVRPTDTVTPVQQILYDALKEAGFPSDQNILQDTLTEAIDKVRSSGAQSEGVTEGALGREAGTILADPLEWVSDIESKKSAATSSGDATTPLLGEGITQEMRDMYSHLSFEGNPLSTSSGSRVLDDARKRTTGDNLEYSGFSQELIDEFKKDPAAWYRRMEENIEMVPNETEPTAPGSDDGGSRRIPIPNISSSNGQVMSFIVNLRYGMDPNQTIGLVTSAIQSELTSRRLIA